MEHKNRLSELRGSMSQKEFAEKIGLTQQNYWKYENGKQGLKSDLIEKICKTFGCTAEWLLCLDYKPSDLPKGAKPTKGMQMGYVPLLGRVHAGPFTEPEDLGDRQELALIPQFLIDADPDTYALEAEGDCMNKVYPEGCTVIVSPNRKPQNGSVAVVALDGHDAIMRRMVRTTNTLILSPESSNPEHKDIVITEDSDHTVEFWGRVVWFQASKEME